MNNRLYGKLSVTKENSMTEYCIESPHFNICFQLKVFESDIQYSSNTIMSVSVISNEFCGKSDMDVDIKDFVIFTNALNELYKTLNGSAIIQEPYGQQQFIKFTADKTGHILVNGKLSANGHNGCMQRLTFENCIDQTLLRDFIENLSLLCKQYF